MNLKDIFDSIYKTSHWGYKSGPGSDPIAAKKWVDAVNHHLENDEIASVLDVGCGDFRLGSKYNLAGKMYYGIDVSSEVMADNVNTDNASFIVGDALKIDLPKADLVLIKDVLQHLPNKEAISLVNRFLNTAKVVLICNDYDSMNIDIAPGGHRGLDLQKDPYNLDVTKIGEFFVPPYTKVVYAYYSDKGAPSNV